jgi:hypothetical protein
VTGLSRIVNRLILHLCRCGAAHGNEEKETARIDEDTTMEEIHPKVASHVITWVRSTAVENKNIIIYLRAFS